MVQLLKSTAVAIAVLYATVTSAAKCSPSSKCSEDLPCCSQYGECGVGAYCLGGCDPISSHTLNSCMPNPICKSADYKFSSLDGIQANTKYLGDASKADWVSSGEPAAYGDQLLLTMPRNSVGTLLASTSYVWYGKTTATLKTSRGNGVVTAFILLSDVKDEIDFEFVGYNNSQAQTNYYFQGITDYTQGGNTTVEDVFGTYHTYEIDWTPDQITWSVDGTEQRKVKKSDTWNATKGRFDYPQTPARVQLSLWPAGLKTNGEGTINWAGGLVNWDSEDIKNAGYYYAMFKEIKIECYDPPSGVKKSGSKAYVYKNISGLNNSIEITDDNTVLGSFLATGEDQDKGKPSGTASADSASATSDVPNVPGLSGAGTGSNGQRGGGAGEDSSSGSQSNSGSSSGSSDSGSSGYHGYSQGLSNSGSTVTPQRGERLLQGSMFAAVLAIAALLAM